MLGLLALDARQLRTDMPKGKKRMKGEPVYHDEVKKSLNLTVTPTGARGLEELAQEFGLKSKSELVDQIGRRILVVSRNPLAEEEGED